MRLNALANLRENKVIANKKCLTVLGLTIYVKNSEILKIEAIRLQSYYESQAPMHKRDKHKNIKLSKGRRVLASCQVSSNFG